MATPPRKVKLSPSPSVIEPPAPPSEQPEPEPPWNTPCPCGHGAVFHQTVVTEAGSRFNWCSALPIIEHLANAIGGRPSVTIRFMCSCANEEQR